MENNIDICNELYVQVMEKHKLFEKIREELIHNFQTTIRLLVSNCRDNTLRFGVDEYIYVEIPVKDNNMMSVYISQIYINDDNELKFVAEQKYGCMQRVCVMDYAHFVYDHMTIENLKTIVEVMYKKVAELPLCELRDKLEVM